MKTAHLLFALLVVFACSDVENLEKEEDKTIDFQFQDSFETSGEFSELFPSDNSRWSNIQLVNPSNVMNTIDVTEQLASDGDGSLVIMSRQSNQTLSKADIEKEGFTAPENSTITIQSDFYIDSDINIENFFLLDLECCSCWDPTVEDNQCPGIRLMMSGGNDYLSIERGKIAGSTISQSTFRFPRKEWVTVLWRLTLAPTDTDGMNELFINGNLVISENGMNMPNPEVFADLFQANGITFDLQQPVVYERVQIGATANPNSGDLLLYVDNFSLTIELN